MVDKTVYFATGNRKESTARVRVIPGSGKMTINGVASENYLQYSPNYLRQRLTRRRNSSEIPVPPLLTATKSRHILLVRLGGGFPHVG